MYEWILYTVGMNYQLTQMVAKYGFRITFIVVKWVFQQYVWKKPRDTKQIELVILEQEQSLDKDDKDLNDESFELITLSKSTS